MGYRNTQALIGKITAIPLVTNYTGTIHFMAYMVPIPVLGSVCLRPRRKLASFEHIIFTSYIIHVMHP